MDDRLLKFLKARLDEDAEAARDASDGPWWDEHPATQWREEKDDEVASSQGRLAVLPFDKNGGSNSIHIARHDPARVLVDVVAKREVLRLAAAFGDYAETFMNGTAAAMEGALRLFALAYADHPEYREEWRP